MALVAGHDHWSMVLIVPEQDRDIPLKNRAFLGKRMRMYKQERTYSLNETSRKNLAHETFFSLFQLERQYIH